MALTASACTGGGGQAEGLSHLWVCPEASFDRGCVRDERAKPLVSSAVYCSAEFVHRKGRHFAARTVFEGEPVTSFEGTVELDSGTFWVTTGTNLGPLPPGRWECKLAIGDESVEAAFRTGGQAGATPVSQAACLTSKAQENDCPPDAQALDESFERPPSVTCESLIVGHGERVQISVLHGEFPEREISAFTMPVSSRNVQLAYATVDPNLLQIKATTVPKGQYICRFAIAGGHTWDVRFIVVGS